MSPKFWIGCFLVLTPLVVSCQQAMAPRAVAPSAVMAASGTKQKAEVALGIRLFFDPRLSRTNRVSCGSCHNPKMGFSNGLPVGVGVDGRTGGRNTPTVLTAKHSGFQFWDGRAQTLEEQALGPIVNPLEMDQDLKALVTELSAIPMYPRLFQQAYGTGVTESGIAKAIAAFERALDVSDSPYDRWLAGDEAALSESAKRGQELFAVRAHCGDCHKGLDLNDSQFHNLGWGLDQPNPDLGRGKITGDPLDMGAFKTPTLRNVAESGPYFHDGRARTLEDVVEFYDKGGLPNPNLDEKIRPIGLSGEEKADLVAFLKALTGTTNLKAIAQEAVEKREVRF
jgi:cytochrome c peroxidase